MLYPSINEIKHKADSRYTLVILAAKRARDLIDGKPALVDCKVNRPVSIAAKEINEDLIKVSYPEDKPEIVEGAEDTEEAEEALETVEGETAEETAEDEASEDAAGAAAEEDEASEDAADEAVEEAEETEE